MCHEWTCSNCKVRKHVPRVETDNVPLLYISSHFNLYSMPLIIILRCEFCSITSLQVTLFLTLCLRIVSFYEGVTYTGTTNAFDCGEKYGKIQLIKPFICSITVESKNICIVFALCFTLIHSCSGIFTWCLLFSCFHRKHSNIICDVAENFVAELQYIVRHRIRLNRCVSEAHGVSCAQRFSEYVCGWFMRGGFEITFIWCYTQKKSTDKIFHFAKKYASFL